MARQDHARANEAQAETKGQIVIVHALIDDASSRAVCTRTSVLEPGSLDYDDDVTCADCIAVFFNASVNLRLGDGRGVHA